MKSAAAAFVPPSLGGGPATTTATTTTTTSSSLPISIPRRQKSALSSSEDPSAMSSSFLGGTSQVSNKSYMDMAGASSSSRSQKRESSIPASSQLQMKTKVADWDTEFRVQYIRDTHPMRISEFLAPYSMNHRQLNTARNAVRFDAGAHGSGLPNVASGVGGMDFSQLSRSAPLARHNSMHLSAMAAKQQQQQLEGNKEARFNEYIKHLNPSLTYLGPVARHKVVRALQLVSESSPEKSTMRAFFVVNLMAELRMDSDAVAAGALKGALVSDEDIEMNVGSEPLHILRENAAVARVINLTADFSKDPDVNSAAVQQLVLTSSTDWRAVAIELVDAVARWKLYLADTEQSLINTELAQRFLSLYAPLANQLGIWSLQSELEELAFEFMYPEECESLRRLVGERLEECAVRLEETKLAVEMALRKSLEVRKLVSSVRIKGRIKGLYSIFRKMQRSGKSFDEIYDMLALRVIVEPRASPSSASSKDVDAKENESCYRVLEVIHSLYKQLGDGSRVKDFLARPKTNGYKSLHTTVLAGDADPKMPLEMQVRTVKMNRLAEFGRAAHWIYKNESAGSGGKYEDEMSCISSISSDNDDINPSYTPRDEFSFAGKEQVSLDYNSDMAYSPPFFDEDTEKADSHTDFITAANRALRKEHMVILSQGRLHYVKAGTTLGEFAEDQLALSLSDMLHLTVNGKPASPNQKLCMSDIVGVDKRPGSHGFSSVTPMLSSHVPSSIF
eukprot:CAMPEP_0184692138 /NCGR_PEP_ID=MMETSP0313-20130426/736_1 /TAXON_ID=2792 /ORGANISM="Porphyridium aerugineum, Strain SAG 1380-2" /LENGTH=732 /DNA_ID=CAMNT_0027149947 /DNA_START=649 /DNA_END=2847 /DNA_ORIENTATION=+